MIFLVIYFSNLVLMITFEKYTLTNLKLRVLSVHEFKTIINVCIIGASTINSYNILKFLHNEFE